MLYYEQKRLLKESSLDDTWMTQTFASRNESSGLLEVPTNTTLKDGSVAKVVESVQRRRVPRESWMAKMIAKHSYRKLICYLVVSVMTVQALLSLMMFLISTRFDPAHGIIESSSTQECHNGWEWYAKHITLIVWAYIVGPYIVWSIRGIRDTHHLKLESTLSIITTIPCFPLFCMAYLTDEFTDVNKHFPPLMWFNISLGMMQILAVFFPILEIRRYRRAMMSADFPTLPDLLEDTEGYDKFVHFSATRDFSAENIIFVKRVTKLKEMWARYEASKDKQIEENAESNKEHQKHHSLTGAGGVVFPWEQEQVRFNTAQSDTTTITICESTEQSSKVSLTSARLARIHRECHNIYDTFVANSAPYQVNLDCDIQRRIIEAIRNNNLTADMFDNAMDETKTLLVRNTYARFCREVANERKAAVKASLPFWSKAMRCRQQDTFDTGVTANHPYAYSETKVISSPSVVISIA